MLKRIPTVVMLGALAGCDVAEPLPGQFGEDEDTVCVRASAEPVSVDDIVTLGSTQDELIEVAVADVVGWVGSRAATLTWQVDASETLVEFSGSGDATDAEVVQYEPASEEIPASMCGTQLVFSVTGSVSTADGRIDESFTTSAASFGEGVYIDVLVDAPQGTVDPVDLSVAPEAVDAAAIDLHLVLRDGGQVPFAGSVSPVRVDDPDDDVAPLGTWPGEIEE